MLKWSLICLVVALVAAFFGFTEIAGAAAVVGKFLFYTFITVFLVMLILALVAGKRYF